MNKVLAIDGIRKHHMAFEQLQACLLTPASNGYEHHQSSCWPALPVAVERPRAREHRSNFKSRIMSTPARQESSRNEENGSRLGGANPSDTETNVGGAQQSEAEGGLDQHGDGEEDMEDGNQEGGGANTNVLEYLKRNTHTKAVEMFEKKKLEEEQAQGMSGSTTANASVTPADGSSRSRPPADTTKPSIPKSSNITPVLPSTSTSSAQQQRPIPTPGEGLPAKDLIKRNLPQAQASSASTSAYYLTPEFMAQAEDVINRHKAGAQAGAAATNSSIAQAVITSGGGAAGAQGMFGPQGVLLDSTDRIMGYVKLRQWVEAGLEGWKVSLEKFIPTIAFDEIICSPTNVSSHHSPSYARSSIPFSFIPF